MPHSLDASIDRFQEAHFFIHLMERHYHDADPFRFALNSFLRALKEVSQLLAMELQNEPHFPKWYGPRRHALMEDPLIDVLAKRRDFVVHRGMLVPKSAGAVGITEARGLKFGIHLPIDPRQDSDDAILSVLSADPEDTLGLLADDEESVPCVFREWKMDPFDDELLDLSATAWLRVGDLVTDVIQWLGGTPPKLSLACRHAAGNVQYRLYDRVRLREQLSHPARES